ncbi:hypothetical protein KKG85_00315 [Patescibacteria group bacterium]|nr:hypothetical protein [Patescibacteria group bacterium]MBU2579556.1 hypothetical protein [Patescibacteria group bacterium]
MKFAVKSKSVAEIQKSALVSAPVSASGIFIVPPGGKEVNRDTAGQRVACRNVGDHIIIESNRPEALFILMDTTRIRIDPVRTVIRIDSLGGKDYLRFQNFGTKTERIKAKIASHR